MIAFAFSNSFYPYEPREIFSIFTEVLSPSLLHHLRAFKRYSCRTDQGDICFETAKRRLPLSASCFMVYVWIPRDQFRFSTGLLLLFILTQAFRGLPQFLQGNSNMVHSNRSSQFRSKLIVTPFDTFSSWLA